MKKDKKPEPRILTPQEMARKEKVDKIIKEKEAEGYVKKDLTISIIYANVMALILGAPPCILFLVLFLKFSWGSIAFHRTFTFIWLAAFLVSIGLHELIHGITWAACTPRRFKAIEFGFMKQYLTPYCTCLEPLSRGKYILGGIMPCIVLGILPMALSIFTHSALLYAYGAAMTFAAGGDLTILLELLKYRSHGGDVICQDHPTEAGLILLELD